MPSLHLGGSGIEAVAHTNLHIPDNNIKGCGWIL